MAAYNTGDIFNYEWLDIVVTKYYFKSQLDDVRIQTFAHSLSGLDAARQRAMEIATNLAASEERAGMDSGAIIVSVRSDADGPLFKLRLAFIIDVP